MSCIFCMNTSTLRSSYLFFAVGIMICLFGVHFIGFTVHATRHLNGYRIANIIKLSSCLQVYTDMQQIWKRLFIQKPFFVVVVFPPALGTYIPLFHTNPHILSGTTIPKQHHDHVAGFTVSKF